MKEFIGYGKIRQFNDVVRDVSNVTKFVGIDEDGTAIYDDSIKLPVVQATSSEKIHGTNAAFCWDGDEFWIQSRKKIIDLNSDNAGCAMFCYKNKDIFLSIIGDLVSEHNIDISDKTVCLYFEFAGGNIQAHSALTGIEKSAVIFQHFRLFDHTKEAGEESTWLKTCVKDSWVHSESDGIHNIMRGQVWGFEIDFEHRAKTDELLEDIIYNHVEPNSPFGRTLGKEGNVGEGVVTTFEYKGRLFRFKSKGDKHTKSRVKKHTVSIGSVDEQKLFDAVDGFLNTGRLDQALDEVFGVEYSMSDLHINKTGDIIKFVINDIIEEEQASILELGISISRINSSIARKTKQWYMELLKTI